MIGNHFKKKFGKRPPPGIMITEVVESRFFEKIETFGTAISNRTETFRIKKEDLLEELELNTFVNKGDTIVNLKSGNLVAPFNGVLGYTGLTEDIFVSDKTINITLDDTKVIFSDIKIPENYSSVVKKGLPIEAKVSSFKDKIFNGEIDFISSRINADTRSLLTRIKIENSNYELISGSLLEVSIMFNLRNSLGVPDTSVMMEGDKAYVYKVSEDNIVNKVAVKIGNRSEGKIEILSGLKLGDIIVAEGLRKVYPRAKINPIKEGEEKSQSSWKKKENKN
jgi:membrane fusion protein (multidrug efflux system)